MLPLAANPDPSSASMPVTDTAASEPAIIKIIWVLVKEIEIDLDGIDALDFHPCTQ